ncbi:outer membrane beta-barrel protein [Sunxiuqinia indica]|uniref:outer membrane beta-barrel protein n=1 Tax=Sunxiuqinia indica TaxID=2692584 RepID=UPI00135B8D58|nr:outer membrane beta-barrel protein [Sunxiuqinia indica]
MKKIGLLLIGLTFAILLNGQTIKIQGGTSISKLDWQNANQQDNKKLIGHAVFAGLDYFDKQYFNLSSNIGLIRKGGEYDINFGSDEVASGKPILDYLSINTTIDFKYSIKEKFAPFISMGPRVDFLVDRRDFYALEGLGQLKDTSFGLILGGGLRYDISNLQFGLRADYYLDFTKVADWTIESTGNSGEVSVNTFTINLTIGYKLK